MKYKRNFFLIYTERYLITFIILALQYLNNSAFRRPWNNGQIEHNKQCFKTPRVLLEYDYLFEDVPKVNILDEDIYNEREKYSKGGFYKNLEEKTNDYLKKSTERTSKSGLKKYVASLEKQNAYIPKEKEIEVCNLNVDKEEIISIDEILDAMDECKDTNWSVKNDCENGDKNIKKKFKKFVKYIFMFTPFIFLYLIKEVYSFVEDYVFRNLLKLF
ncbi:hypothetical protein MKS88_005243 [Plasmodium brasilianum]|uniref:Uncharacterized protein n=1 Tax=Plasmodium brasilianum TaxID=5824 RepID=A0ACB9Y1M9_PLABR|nr:hypothetical protein MKS88_005243 [Plasmodium brasilianum]